VTLVTYLFLVLGLLCFAALFALTVAVERLS
jgi:hypothetical protein